MAVQTGHPRPAGKVCRTAAGAARLLAHRTRLHFDGSAVNALRNYQFQQGLPITGVADRTTLSTAAGLADSATAAGTDVPGARHDPRRSRSDRRRCASRADCCSSDTTCARSTASSTAARRRRLNTFQFWNGLASTAVADRQTLERLGIYTDTPSSPPPTYLPANSGTGRRIVYSRGQQRIWVVESDGRIVKSHRVSGRTYEPLAGTYHVYSRSLYTYSAKDPSVRWRYMVRFAYGFQGGRIGFHEIPNRNGVPLQSKEQLGLPLSGGCVRQSTADAQWLWNWAYIGTKVVVL